MTAKKAEGRRKKGGVSNSRFLEGHQRRSQSFAGRLWRHLRSARALPWPCLKATKLEKVGWRVLTPTGPSSLVCCTSARIMPIVSDLVGSDDCHADDLPPSANYVILLFAFFFLLFFD